MSYLSDAPDAPLFPDAPFHVFVLRPDGTSLWMEPEVAAAVGAREDDVLSEGQMSNPEVLAMIDRRLARRAAKGGKRG